ncbi:MAG: hypothetical protein QG567_74 [Campylobacterota bacterium]|nr:hypothetical protein [Campylobacterota bacterium]
MDVSLVNEDKIIKIQIQKLGKYKSQKSSLIFEFTGKFTNMIIVDENEIVIEALRHIDSSISSRELKPSLKYMPLPKNNIKYSNPQEISDIRAYLEEEYQKREAKELENTKKQQLDKIVKKREKLQNILFSLEHISVLEEKSQKSYEIANILLLNRAKIKPYDKKAVLKDYDGNDVVIELEAMGNINKTIDEVFKKAKKFMNKSKNIHIERENLESKIEFFKKFESVINMAKSKHELAILFPKIIKTKKESVAENYEVFFIKGYRVLLGKNEKGNIELLRMAKANDIWMHLKDRPSTHVIIPTNKSEIPLRVLEEAARLCASFSADFGGNYLVDYTQRRNVKIKSGASVEYKFYKTIHISI